MRALQRRRVENIADFDHAIGSRRRASGSGSRRRGPRRCRRRRRTADRPIAPWRRCSALKTAASAIGAVGEIGPDAILVAAVGAAKSASACASASSGTSVTARPLKVTRSGRLAGRASTSGPTGWPNRFVSMSSMIVPRHAHRLRQALIVHRRLQHHALVELGDHFALDLLPGRLALRDRRSRRLLQRGAARRQLLVGNEDVGRCPA